MIILNESLPQKYWIFKNSYLIHVLLKYSNFFLEWFLQYTTHFCTISLKNTKIKLKIGTKSSDWKFYRD